MLDDLLTRAADRAPDPTLADAVADHVAALTASAGRGDRDAVGRAEADVRADPGRAFAFAPDGAATLTAHGRSWAAGRFETATIGALRTRAAAAGGDGGTAARLWVLDGAGPATDIGALQATTGGRPLFQVASQFNCLEAPSAYLVPVAEYFHDYTQGPRASVSAFPATLLRHYAAPAPDGTRFVQRNGGPQIDLLADVFAPGESPVASGYLKGHGGLGADALVNALEDGFDRIRVGVHADAQVVLGYDWDGAADGDRRVAQVFTSTVAGGGYGGGSLGAAFEPTCQHLLRAAYLGTVLAAVDLGRSPVVLTLIGGGVFGNPIGAIWDAILWAFDTAQPLARGRFDVAVNGRDLVARLGLPALLAGARPRGGAVVRFDRRGLAGIDR